MQPEEQCKLHSETLTRVDERVKEMHKWMFGNGQPGAAGRLVALETTVSDMKRPRQWPAVVASICAIGVFVANLIWR